MPRFNVNGQEYNVKDSDIAKFASYYPNATTIIDRDDNNADEVRAMDYETYMQEMKPAKTTAEIAKDVAKAGDTPILPGIPTIGADKAIPKTPETDANQPMTDRQREWIDLFELKKNKNIAEHGLDDNAAIVDNMAAYKQTTEAKPSLLLGNKPINTKRGLVDVGGRTYGSQFEADYGARDREYDTRLNIVQDLERRLKEIDGKVDKEASTQAAMAIGSSADLPIANYGAEASKHNDAERQQIIEALRDNYDYLLNNDRGNKQYELLQTQAEINKIMDRHLAEDKKLKQESSWGIFADDNADTNYNPYDTPAMQADSELQALKLRERELQGQIKDIDAKQAYLSDADKLYGSTANFFRSVGGVLGKVDTWDMGKHALRDATTIYQIANKMDNGNTLTDNETNALKSLYDSQYVKDVYGDLGKSGQYGTMAGESLAFMIDMAIGTKAFGNGKAVGKLTDKLATNLTKKAMEKAGKKYAGSLAQNFAEKGIMDVVRNAPKGSLKQVFTDLGTKAFTNDLLVRAVGSTADTFLKGGALATTVQGQKTFSNVVNTKLGKVCYDDNTGEYKFENGTSWINALYQELGDMAVENTSEMIGAKFLGLADATKLLGFRKLSNWLSKASAPDAEGFIANTNKILQKTGINGYFGEVGEEYWGQFARTALGLDSAYDQYGNNNLLDSEFHFDTWMGLLTTMGLTSSAGATFSAGNEGIKYGKYQYYKHNLSKSDNKALSLLGEHQWTNLRDMIDRTDNVGLHGIATAILHDKVLTQAQKDAAMNYMQNTIVMRGYNRGKYLKAKFGKEEGKELEEQFNKGYNTTEDKQKAVIEANYQTARQRVIDLGGESIAEDVDNRGDEVLNALGDDANLNNAILSMLNAKAMRDGLNQRVADDIDSQTAQANTAIDAQTNKQSGKIVTATLKEQTPDGQDKTVFVVSGNVATTPEGVIDNANSSQSIIIKDANTGELSQVAPTALLRIDEEQDAEEAKKEMADAIKVNGEYKAKAAQEGLQPFNAGDKLQMPDGNGNTMQLTVVPNQYGQTINADGTVLVTDGTNLYSASIDVLNEHNPIGSQQASQPQAQAKQTAPQTQPAPPQQQQPQPQTYNVEDEIELTDDNGNKTTAIVTDIDADGTYTLSADSPINGKKVLTMSANEIASRQQVSQPQAEEQTQSPKQSAPQQEQQSVQTEQGEQDYESMQPEQAYDKLIADMGDSTIASQIATAQMEQAKAELEKLQKKAPKLSGTPAEMKQALSEHNGKIADAQRKLDAWTAINAVWQQRRADEQKRIREENDRKQAEASAKAVAELEEQKKQEAERQAEQERIGTNAVNPKISEKWNNAHKVQGNSDIITLADGTTLEGHYVLTEAGNASASHDVNNAFAPTEGFPVDENGQNINDRDYERDQEAQRIVQEIADNFDNRALQTPVVVSNDGVVLSGNNRTMSGDLAAKQGTDTAYIEYLRKYGAKYGFTTEQIDGMQHPRVVFVPTELLPYTSETFARFNAEDKKTQNKSEKAVKMSKVVADDVFKAIVAEIARYETLSDFYSNQNSVKFAVEMLLESGVINANNMAELLDNGNISAIGKELLENVLIGKAFQTNPDAVRQIIAIPSLRQAIVMGLSEIAVNRTLDNAGYGLSEELANAIGLVYKARTDTDANVKLGDAVSAYARQLGLFDYEFNETPIEDITTLLLADILNSTKPGELRKVLALYNASASASASGQMDMFSGAVRTKQEILIDVNNTFNNANNKERERIATEAIADRKQRAEETAQTATAQRGNQASEEEVELPNDAKGEKAEQTENTEEITPEQSSLLKRPNFAQYPTEQELSGNKDSELLQKSKEDAGENENKLSYEDFIRTRALDNGFDKRVDLYVSDEPDKYGEILGASSEYPNIEAVHDTKSGRVFYRVFIKGRTDKITPSKEQLEEKGYYDNPFSRAGDRYAHIECDTYDEAVELENLIRNKEFNKKKRQPNDTPKKVENKKEVSSEKVTDAPYSITPAQYTTKKGKALDMQLVKLQFDVTAEQKKLLSAMAKQMKGWWDKNQQGFMMRSDEDAKTLAEYAVSLNESKQLTLEDVKEVTDGKTQFTQPKNEESVKEENSPKWQYTVTVDSDGYTTVKREDVSSPIPVIDGHFNLHADSPEEMTDILSNPLNGMQEVLDEVGQKLRNAITLREEERRKTEERRKERERIEKNGINGFKIGEEVLYKGKSAKIHDFEEYGDRKPVLDDGMAPVIYTVADWSDISKLKSDSEKAETAKGPATPTPKKVDTASLMGALKTKGEAKLSEHAEKKNEGQFGLVSDERMAELKDRLRNKLLGQMNIGIDPEILSIGLEIAVGHLDRGVKTFTDFAKVMISDLGDAIRPYLKAFYNGARELPEVVENGLASEMTSYEEVQKFDVTNFDKEGFNAIETARTIVREEEVEQEAEMAKVKISRNKKKKEKKSLPLQQSNEMSLFDETDINENTEENGLQGIHEFRTEGLPSDSYRNSETGSGREDNAEVRQDIGRTERSGEERTGGTDRTLPNGDGRFSGRLPRLKKNTRNNHSERGKDHAPTSVDARIEANIKAIELAKQLLESGEQATKEQMRTLRKFSGWGGLGKAFKDGTYYEPNPTAKRLRELLGEDAYQDALLSANSAYYTPAYVTDTLWDIAEQMGFKGGNILEGSAGIGNILGQMPAHISEQSDIHAVEIDSTSGSILSLLYPDAKVDVQGFEQTQIPNGSVDLAITNVPFVTGLRVNDTTGDKDLSRKFHNIQDFCIAKNVRKLREGGIGIFITTSGTLDNSRELRNWVVNEGGADFVGAFRMHNKTFVGTGVTTDIIVIRKRVNGQKSANAIDVSEVSGERTAEYNTGETKTVKGKKEPIIKPLSMEYNKYFIEHPDNIAGEMAFGFENGDTYRPTSKGLYPKQGKEQRQMLEEFVRSFKEEEIGKRTDESKPVATEGRKIGEVFVKNGELYINADGTAHPLNVNSNKVKGHTKAECYEAYSRIKKALSEVLEYQTDNEDNKGLKPLLDKLNKAYDDFVTTYGHFNKNTAIAFLRNDVDYYNVASVETYKEKGDGKGGLTPIYGKADVMKGRVVDTEKTPTPTNIKEGIIVSISRHGRIDIPYISELLHRSEDDVKREIIESGLGFENPTTKQIDASFQYLSGNIREKIQQAEANNSNGKYDRNIKALNEVLPMDIPVHLIEFTLGSSWVDPKIYEDYVKERTGISVRLIPVGGSWYMEEPYYTYNEQNTSMGVKSEVLDKTILGHKLIEAAIQNKTITVSATKKNWDGTKETITDKDATQACFAKIEEIRQDFKEWARQKMQNDTDMAEKLERIYNDKFNNYVPITIPSDFTPKHFIGASPKFEMRPHQSKAIIRGTMQPVLLAHEVGSGKTFTLISTAMEMRRMGIARKPMIVVQNATAGQFVADAKKLYPNAKILTIDDSDRGEEGRKNFYAKIKYNDWDMIVIPQSTFDFIPDSEERQMEFIKDKIEEKQHVLDIMAEMSEEGTNYITKRAERELSVLEDELAELTERSSRKRKTKDEKKRAVSRQNSKVKAEEMLDRKVDDVENFDEMGIDALLIDEAHEYKHLGFATAMQRGVKGVDPSYSKKSQGLYLKAHSVFEKNGGRNVVFATGTPISNTAAEIWTFMRYLMPEDTMKQYDIYYFDDFVRNFGNIQAMLEFTTSGKFKETNRFAGYVNLPELVRIWSQVSDTILFSEIEEERRKKGEPDLRPEIEGGKAQDIYLPQTRALRSVMKYVKKQLQDFENMSGKEKKENSHIPLVMYGIAKQSAVDARLVLDDAEDDPNSKTNEAVRQTLKSLKETDSYKGTVAIFADTYQNKNSGFNLYEDIKKKLIAKGVPANEIAIIRSGMTVKKKLEIFQKVNRGEIRVILGSTFTLGTGVNIQERLHTLIHVDAPNRPMDYTQRNGRIHRQGNIHKDMGKPIRILRFGVEDSLDVTAYQRLKTKGAIADSIMHGKQMLSNSMENRILEEEEDAFGDTVAQLSGSEYAMLKNNAEKNVRKYSSRKKSWEAYQIHIHNTKPKVIGLIKNLEQRIKDSRTYLNEVRSSFPDGKYGQITIGNHKFTDMDSMDDFFKAHNKKALADMKGVKEGSTNGDIKKQLSINIGGFEFVVSTSITKQTVGSGSTLRSEVERKMTYSCPELGIENTPVQQNLLRNAVIDITENVISGKDFAESIETAENSKKRYEDQLNQLLASEGKPFEFEEELKKAENQYEEYSELMKEEMLEKEKKYAEMDAGIETASANRITISENDDSSVSEDEDNMYRIGEDLEEVNARFNEELQQQIDGTLPQGHIYQLGMASAVLQSAGLPNLPIELSASRLKEKSMQEEHPFELSEMNGLVEGVQNPLAVFRSATHIGSFVVLTEIEHQGKNFVVAIQANRRIGRIVINNIRSVYPKKNSQIANWITEGLLEYADKKRMAEWFSKQRSNSADVRKLFNHATKIVNEFDNPSIDEENLLRKPVGGNSGYVGYSMSKRAERAREEGRFPKTDFKKEYKVSENALQALARVGIISNNEWHHTSSYGNKTAFYGWTEEGYAEYYLDNKKEIDKASTDLLKLREEDIDKYYSELADFKKKMNESFDAYADEYANEQELRSKTSDAIIAEYQRQKREYASTEGTSNSFPSILKWQSQNKDLVKEIENKVRQEMQSSPTAITDSVMSLAERLHLGNVEIVTDASALSGKEARAKGFYTKSTGKITIVVPNNTSAEDAVQTLLHEAVAHYGLRQLFGSEFDNFLDAVLENADKDVLERIFDLARANGWNYRKATEEYLATLAETTDFENTDKGWWNKVKELFVEMLRKLGIKALDGTTLTDNELRYILWASYQNLKGSNETLIGVANDIVKREDLGIENSEDDTLLRSDEEQRLSYERAMVRDIYDQRMASGVYQSIEALQDSMRSVKEFMGMVDKAENGKARYIEDIDDFENAYLGENRLSSQNKAETDLSANLLFKPLLKAINKLAHNDAERTELKAYLYAKHGLERNPYMRRRAAEERARKELEDKVKKPQKEDLESESEYKEAINEYKEQIADIANTPQFVTLANQYESEDQRDYSGLTALMKRSDDYKELTTQEAEARARAFVDEYESEHDEDSISDLWDRIRAITNAELTKRYESGLLSKAAYTKIKGMYEYYIPLRGFDEKTAEDQYAYMNTPQGSVNFKVRAEGRNSLADDPIANLAMMMEQAIIQGNRNQLVKQRFLNFVLNHPSDLVAVNQPYLAFNEIEGTWYLATPDIKSTDTAREVQDKWNEFNERMERLVKEEPDKYKRQHENPNIPYRVVNDKDMKEHEIIVKQGKKTYLLTINGNPRLAQAINGLTNPDNQEKSALGALVRGVGNVNRWMANAYTTANVNFTFGNLMRDMVYSNSIIWVKESPAYAMRFHWNCLRCNPKVIKSLLKKHRKGTLDMSKPIEREFYEFMMNGGETGFTEVNTIERHKSRLKAELKKQKKYSARKAWDLFKVVLGEWTRSVENVARFAAYRTSRKMGRTIGRSIYDAKEISVNFNKKGSGDTMYKMNGQTALGNTSAFVSGSGRNFLIFWNASLQGMTNFGRQAKRHPWKVFSGASAMFALAMVTVMLSMEGDDDDEQATSYFDLPEYVRRSNIMFRVGEDWISIPLPIEYRAVYGMGELMMSAYYGKEDGFLPLKMAEQVTQILPIDFLQADWEALSKGEEMQFVASAGRMVAPSFSQPVYDIFVNRDWTGMPIYKDSDFIKNKPNWTKHYSNTNKFIVDFCERMNTIGSRDGVQGNSEHSGWIDINPAMVQHLLEGYLGGWYSNVDQAMKTVATIAGEREYDPRNIILLNRIVKSGDDRTEERAMRNKYFKYIDEYDRTKSEYNSYIRKIEEGDSSFEYYLNQLQHTPRFGRYQIVDEIMPEMRSVQRDKKKYLDEASQNELKAEEVVLQNEIVNTIKRYNRLLKNQDK